MSKQITMRRNAFEGGSLREAGATYTVDDAIADAWIAKGWAIPGAIYGDQFSAPLAAPARATGNPTLVVTSSTAGYQAFQAVVPTLAAGDVVVIAWSRIEDDSAGLGAAIDAVCDQLEAASPPGTPVANTRIITASNQWIGAVWDEIDRIKSIAAVVCKLGATTGGTAQRVMLDLVY